jgi:hypothetical protein
MLSSNLGRLSDVAIFYSFSMQVQGEFIDHATNTSFQILSKSEVRTSVFINSSVFWYTTLCSPLKVNRHYGETRCLHLQCGRSWYLPHSDFLLDLFFNSEDEGNMFIRNIR